MGAGQYPAIQVGQRDDQTVADGLHRKARCVLAFRGVLHEVAGRLAGREGVVVDVEVAGFIQHDVAAPILLALHVGVGLAAGDLAVGQVHQAEGVDVGVRGNGALAVLAEGQGMGGKGQLDGVLQGQGVGVQRHQGPWGDVLGHLAAEGGIQGAVMFVHLIEAPDVLGLLVLVAFRFLGFGLRLIQAVVVAVIGPLGVVAFQLFAAAGGFEVGGVEADGFGGCGAGLAGGGCQGSAAGQRGGDGQGDTGRLQHGIGLLGLRMLTLTRVIIVHHL